MVLDLGLLFIKSTENTNVVVKVPIMRSVRATVAITRWKLEN